MRLGLQGAGGSQGLGAASVTGWTPAAVQSGELMHTEALRPEPPLPCLRDLNLSCAGEETAVYAGAPLLWPQPLPGLLRRSQSAARGICGP